jgi:hypothetical protein
MAGGYRRPEGDIVAAELSSLLRQVIVSGMRGMFEEMMKGNAAAQGLNVTIINNAGASISARESGGGMTQKQLEITVDQMVANSLVQGRQTSGVLRALFGIGPGLIGR